MLLRHNAFKELKNGRQGRSGVSFVEIIISMVLIGVIFATFLVSIGNLLIHNTKTNTILEFMYHTSQSNLDPKVNNVGVYLDKKANLITAKKRLTELEKKPDEHLGEIEALRKEIDEYLKALNTSDRYSHNVLFPKNTAGNRAIYEMSLPDLNRGVTVANLFSSKDEYLNTTWRDKDSGEIIASQPNNKIYSFGKTSGAERLYSLVSLEVMTTSLPKQKPTNINREFVYPHEVNTLELTTRWTADDAQDENGFLYYTYWYRASSDQSGADALFFTDPRNYFNAPDQEIYNLGIEQYLTANAPADPGSFKRLNETKDQKRFKATGNNNLLNYGGTWLSFGVQPIYGYAGAAYPAQLSGNSCYVIPLPYAKEMKPLAHYNPSYMGLLSEPTGSGKNKYSNLLELEHKKMGMGIEGTSLTRPTYRQVFANTDKRATRVAIGNTNSAMYIPVLTNDKRGSRPNERDYAHPIFDLMQRSVSDAGEKSLDDMNEKRSQHDRDILPLEPVVTNKQSSANVFRRNLKVPDCAAARIKHIRNQGNWKDAKGSSFSPKLLSLNNLKSSIDGAGAVGLTFYAFDCNQDQTLTTSTDNERWKAETDFTVSAAGTINRTEIQDRIKNSAESLNRHTLIQGDSGELGYFFFNNTSALIYGDSDKKDFVCIPYLKAGEQYYLPKTPEGIDDASFFYTICPYNELSSVMVFGTKIWFNGYPLDFDKDIGDLKYIGGGQGNLNLAEILIYGKTGLSEDNMHLVHDYMTLGRTTGAVLDEIKSKYSPGGDMDKYPNYKGKKDENSPSTSSTNPTTPTTPTNP